MSLLSISFRCGRIFLAGTTIVLANVAAHAQSCALCYTQAAGSGHRLIQGLRSGILVRIIPPMFMSIGITWLAYKKRNRTNALKESERSNNDW
jgi:hypothetical protein